MSGLFVIDGRIKAGSWPSLLQIRIETRRFEDVELDGTRNKVLWFRLKEPDEENSEFDESLTPRSAKAEEYLDDFYKRFVMHPLCD